MQTLKRLQWSSNKKSFKDTLNIPITQQPIILKVYKYKSSKYNSTLCNLFSSFDEFYQGHWSKLTGFRAVKMDRWLMKQKSRCAYDITTTRLHFFDNVGHLFKKMLNFLLFTIRSVKTKWLDEHPYKKAYWHQMVAIHH